jgi:hypothetical protein
MVLLQIIFEGMEMSGVVRARVKEGAEKVERSHGRIASCQVVEKVPNHHGGLFETRIHMTMPGDLEVNIGRHHD